MSGEGRERWQSPEVKDEGNCFTSLPQVPGGQALKYCHTLPAKHSLGRSSLPWAQITVLCTQATAIPSNCLKVGRRAGGQVLRNLAELLLTPHVHTISHNPMLSCRSRVRPRALS